MEPPSKNHFSGRIAKASRTSGPLSFMNPTTRYLPIEESNTQRSGSTSSGGGGDGATGPYYVWRSRDNRKGRHTVAASKEYYQQPKWNALRGMGKMCVRYPVWDVSYDVAMMFTLGSIVWVINGFFVWYPLYNTASAIAPESKLAGGVSALIGATIFEVGAALMMLEAVNESRTDCFGWALKEATESGAQRLEPRHENCRHSHREKGSWLRGKRRRSTRADSDEDQGASGKTIEDNDSGRMWAWLPSLRELRTHYLKEIGFLACAIQMTGATVFWISGFTGLPPILNALSIPASNGIYWLPQVIGGSGFIISGALFMLETQSKWYMPSPMTLGWHVGFWNFLGGVGFTLCGAFGFDISSDPIEYASALSTFIGAWAFLIGSVVQWYECLDKYPVSTVEEGQSMGGEQANET